MQSYDFSKCEIYQDGRYALTDYLCDAPGSGCAHMTYADCRNRLFVCVSRPEGALMVPLADYYAYGLHDKERASRSYQR